MNKICKKAWAQKSLLALSLSLLPLGAMAALTQESIQDKIKVSAYVAPKCTLVGASPLTLDFGSYDKAKATDTESFLTFQIRCASAITPDKFKFTIGQSSNVEVGGTELQDIWYLASAKKDDFLKYKLFDASTAQLGTIKAGEERSVETTAINADVANITIKGVMIKQQTPKYAGEYSDMVDITISYEYGTP